MGGVENPQCVGAFLKHLIDGHCELLGGRTARLVPGHQSLALDEESLRPRLDGKHLGNREAGDEESACHDLFIGIAQRVNGRGELRQPFGDLLDDSAELGVPVLILLAQLGGTQVDLG